MHCRDRSAIVEKLSKITAGTFDAIVPELAASVAAAGDKVLLYGVGLTARVRRGCRGSS